MSESEAERLSRLINEGLAKHGILGGRNPDGVEQSAETLLLVLDNYKKRLQEESDWKNAALDLYGALSQVKFGLSSVNHYLHSKALQTCIEVIDKAQVSFEKAHPPDGQAGWERKRSSPPK